jgi:hypothetical protein
MDVNNSLGIASILDTNLYPIPQITKLIACKIVAHITNVLQI